VQNRNALLWLYPGAVGVKTGYTSAAGYCIAATAEREDVRLIAVVLGAPGEPFSDAAALLDYGFTAFESRALVDVGERLGNVTIDGREVPIVSGGSLTALIPVEADVRRRVVLDAGVRFPPLEGSTVGTLRVSTTELALGQVPVVVAGVPEPAPPRDVGPWWRRAGASVVRAVGSVVSALFG
jgi:D-alanyl-D-alanine carboxypeptidase (penicillin-binding protein 5/6)